MAGPPVRERYNAKARGSTAGGGHKKRKRPKIKELNEDGTPVDQPAAPPVEVEDPGEGDGRGKMSSKKRKRMDSYINKKLKTADRLQTLNLLASLAPSAKTSAALASTGSLGQNPLAPTSAMERHDWMEDRAVRKGIEKLNRRTGGVDDDDESESEEDVRSDEATMEAGPSRRKIRAVEVIEEIPRDTSPTVNATAVPAPTAATPKKKRKAKKAAWNPNLLSTQPGDGSSSSDFDSSDSAYDSDSEDERPDTTVAPAPVALAEPMAGPSSPRLISSSPAPAPPKPIITGSALKSAPSLPTPGPTTFGGALKKSANGAVVQPRVVQRRQKMPLGRRAYGAEEDDDESSASGSEAGEDSDDDDEDESGSGEDDDGQNDDEGDSEDEEDMEAPKKRSLGFKSWAMKQMGQSTPSESTPNKPEPPPFAFAPPKTPRVAPQTGEFVGPLGAKMAIPASSLIDVDSKVDTARPKLARRASVAESRMDLPILAEEQSIVEAIRMNPVVIIAGETGSGKTTQVPQMLYEAGFGFKASETPLTAANPGMIAVTQPRRVAAVSLSNRVRDELGFKPSSSIVAHQIRYSSTTSPETAIKFMTDGVLLRELASDFLLSRYSVVVVDEAHERGVNTDVLIGVLSRVAKLREAKWRANRGDATKSQDSTIKPLRIVIMSATLRIEDFASNTSLFATPPPVIHIPARQHPVTMHFSRKTTGDYVQEAYKKVCKIHARLPQGGVLVFMTGQAEIMQLCRRLEKKYAEKPAAIAPGKKTRKEEKEDKAERSTNEVELAAEEREAEDVELGNDDDLAADVDDGDAESDPEALDSDDDEAGLNLEIDEASDTPMTVLPLYSLLSNEQQMRVFQPPPEGHRLVIIATNVAETSLTIPGIRYVVDSGRSKERDYDIASGVQSFKVSWISKASANQRAGRAGRTGPGHCYRLYSSALFEDHFAKFSTPEILRMPIEGVVLQMKSMNIDQVVNFPFPTPPDRVSLAKAEKLLESLGALEKPTMTRMIAGRQHTGIEGGKITDLGRAMSRYPVSPRFAKMLVIGDQHDCLPYIVTIVAGLSVGDPFIHENTLDASRDDVDSEEDGAVSDDEDVKRKSRKAEIGHIRSEELRAKEERKDMRKKYFDSQARFMGLGGGTSDMFKLLAAVGAYEYDPTASFCHQNFLRLKAMQEIQQLRGQICNITKQPMHRLAPPTDTQTKVIRQILTASSLDRIAVRQDIFLKRSTAFPSCRGVAYRAIGLGAEEVFVHPSSALFHRPAPEYITFHEITRSQGGRGRTWVKGVTKINPGWLSSLGKASCTFSKPEVAVTKGRAGAGGKAVQLREGEREVLVTPHFGDLGVDLPVVRMRQRREGTRWVLVE